MSSACDGVNITGFHHPLIKKAVQHGLNSPATCHAAKIIVPTRASFRTSTCLCGFLVSCIPLIKRSFTLLGRPSAPILMAFGMGIDPRCRCDHGFSRLILGLT